MEEHIDGLPEAWDVGSNRNRRRGRVLRYLPLRLPGEFENEKYLQNAVEEVLTILLCFLDGALAQEASARELHQFIVRGRCQLLHH